MFIRPCHRTKNGKRHAYWALVESVRPDRGPRQRTVAYLGQLDEAGRLGVKRAAQGNERSDEQQLRLGEDDSPGVQERTFLAGVGNCRGATAGVGAKWVAGAVLQVMVQTIIVA